jgi:hypothetical protein
MHSSCQRRSHGNADEKKKSDGEGKKIRTKIMEKVEGDL